MRNEILEVARRPDIVFTPRHIDGHLDTQGNFHARIDGVLAIHGSDHPLTIETQEKLSDNNVIATGHLAIPYVKWSLKDPSVLFLSVAKVVDIYIATTGHVTWQTDAPRLDPLP
jgi:hypothetical protein